MKMTDNDKAEFLKQLADDDPMIEIGRKAIETTLIEFRDMRLSTMGRGNGLVVREKDGKDSHIIRFGPEMGLGIALRAIAEHFDD